MIPIIFGEGPVKPQSRVYWVAVDLGTSTIKASVLDKRNNPVRLSYPMGDHATTLLSSVVVVTEDKKVIIGDYATQLGVSNPNMRVYDWLHSVHKSLIAKTIFETIKQASIKHYNNSSIGVVLLYNNIVDPELECIAKTVFGEVQTMQVGKVLKHIISPNSNLMLIADFGESAFRVTLQDKAKCLYQNYNNSLGFSSFDMLSLIDCGDVSSHSSIEIALLGQMMQRIKIMANNGGEVVLPNNISAKGNSLSSSFEQKMTTFLYQCFEECTNALKSSSKSWNDIEEVVFVGGGAHSNIIDTIFEKYMQSHCTLVSYNSKNSGFDAQYAATNCAIQMPLRTNTGVVIKY